MKLLLSLALAPILLFVVGCNKPQSDVASNSPAERTPLSNPSDLFAFDFYYRIPDVGTYELRIQPLESGVDLRFNSSHGINVSSENSVDFTLVTDLFSLLEKYDVYSWEGFNTKSDNEALETETFSMTINYGGGDMLFADGEDSFPENFHEFYKELHELTLAAVVNREDASTLNENIDYSHYTALIDSKKQEFSDLETVITYSYEDTELYESYGLVYANLMDLDNDGILELIVVASKEGDLSYDNKFDYAGNHIEIYTITEQDELQKVGELPLLLLPSNHLSSGAEYAVTYSYVDGKCYIATGKETGDTLLKYYQYSRDGLELATTLETILAANLGTFFSIDGKDVELEEFSNHYKKFKQSAISHSLSGIPIDGIEPIQKINNETLEFLSRYPQI